MPSSELDPAIGDLVLRVCGSARHGQIVRLRSAKCTIGSGPRCTLRLRAGGVQPVHCLIVRGSDRTVIRRWSPDTRLNGRAFTDAELVGGDRLSIGAIELEVLEPGRRPAVPTENQQTEPQQTAAPQPPDPGRWYRRRLDQLTARLTLANRQGRQRVRRLVAKLRSANREIAQFRARQAEPPELQEQLNEQTEALDACRNDLHLQREELQRERREWETQQAEEGEWLRQRHEQLDALQAELDAHRADFQQRGEETETEQATSSSPQVEPAAHSAQSQQPESGEASQEAPIDTADVFREMGCRRSTSEAELFSEEEQQDGPWAKPEPQTSEDPAADQDLPSHRAADSEQEESIDQYMARLMDRLHAVQGNGGRAESGPPEPLPAEQPPKEAAQGISEPAPTYEPAPCVTSEPAPPDEPAPPAASGLAPPNDPPTPRTGSPPGQQPSEIAPRAVAPEKRVDLSVMRDLANLSAHNAIHRHARRQARLATRGTRLIMAIGLVAGGALLWIWWTTEAGSATFSAAMVGFLVALLWGIQYAELTGRIIVNKPDPLDWEPDEQKRSSKGEPTSEGPVASPDSEPYPASEGAAEDLQQELQTLLDRVAQQ